MSFSFSSISTTFSRFCRRTGRTVVRMKRSTIRCTGSGKSCRSRANALQGSGRCRISRAKLALGGRARCTSCIRTGKFRMLDSTTLRTRGQLGRGFR